MPRYIDLDKLLTDEITHTLPLGCGRSSGRVVVFVEDIEKAPTEDVVPRSEIAKEIFEEIEEGMERWESMCGRDHYGYGGDAYGYLQTDVDHTIYILKKKYTEGENK